MAELGWDGFLEQRRGMRNFDSLEAVTNPTSPLLYKYKHWDAPIVLA